MMRESRCIICGERRDGLEVMDDPFINAIRWFKRNVTRNEKNYRLVVCRDDFLKYKKSRDGFVKKQIAYTTLGVLFAVVLVAISAGGRLQALAAGVGITLFLYLLSLLSYTPAIRMPEPKKK